MIVCLEPWAERYRLESNESIEFVFVGPDVDCPEVIPYSDELMIYGWEGSDVIAVQNGRLVARQPTVDEIVRQEMEIAKERVKRTDKKLPDDQIAWVQQTLDAESELTQDAQELACELAAVLAIELAPSFMRSNAATELLWNVVSRLIGTRGLLLGAPDPETKEAAVWGEHPGVLAEAIRRQAISVLPRRFARSIRKRRNPIKPRPSESESDPTPR